MQAVRLAASQASQVIRTMMTQEEKQLLAEHVQAIAKILYKNAPIKELTSLGKIESVVRSQMQEHVMPSVGVFLSKMSQERTKDTNEK